MNPRASVVIPAYRRPGPVARAVRSALAQTEPNIEVIVIDDASGDGTAEAAEAAGDARARVLRQERNGGACAARNRGIREARGEFIALLDSDDELLPQSVERRIAALEANPGASFVYSRMHYALSAGTRIIQPAELPPPGEPLVESLIVRKGLATSSLLARAGALKQCLFDESLVGTDDWDVALRLARLGPPCFVEEPLTVVHAENTAEGERLSFSYDPAPERRFIELHRAEFAAAPRAEAAFQYRLAMRAVRARDRATAGESLARALALEPGHRKARAVSAALSLGLWPVLPALLRARWAAKLASGRLG